MSRYRILRKRNRLLQIQIAMKTGIDQSVYSKIECGRREASLSQCRELATLFGTSMDYLAELTDEETPYPRSKKETRSGIKP